jgi:hypothetical protein
MRHVYTSGQSKTATGPAILRTIHDHRCACTWTHGYYPLGNIQPRRTSGRATDRTCDREPSVDGRARCTDREKGGCGRHREGCEKAQYRPARESRRAQRRGSRHEQPEWSARCPHTLVRDDRARSLDAKRVFPGLAQPNQSQNYRDALWIRLSGGRQVSVHLKTDRFDCDRSRRNGQGRAGNARPRFRRDDSRSLRPSVR